MKVLYVIFFAVIIGSCYSMPQPLQYQNGTAAGNEQISASRVARQSGTFGGNGGGNPGTPLDQKKRDPQHPIPESASDAPGPEPEFPDSPPTAVPSGPDAPPTGPPSGPDAPPTGPPSGPDAPPTAPPSGPDAPTGSPSEPDAPSTAPTDVPDAPSTQPEPIPDDPSTAPPPGPEVPSAAPHLEMERVPIAFKIPISSTIYVLNGQRLGDYLTEFFKNAVDQELNKQNGDNHPRQARDTHVARPPYLIDGNITAYQLN